MSKKFNWAGILLEAGMIVLSVLLALFINEWRNTYNDKRETKKILGNIRVEIENNQQFTETLIAYHTSILQKVEKAALSDSLAYVFMRNGLFEIYDVAPKGIIQGDLHTIAWIVAKEEKISNRISFDKAQTLFSVYEQQQRVKNTVDRIIGILSSREIHREELLEESVIVFATELNELVTQEKDLNYQYLEALKTLNENE